MTKIKDIIRELEQWAPLPYQESYDNAGLILGNRESPVSKAVICLDVTAEVVREAIEEEAQLLIAHHPLIFKGIKNITPQNPTGRCIIEAIKHDVAIYAIHTNLDNVLHGVNNMLAQKLDIHPSGVLSPRTDLLAKLTTFVPAPHTHQVLEALYSAGAGNIGAYGGCSFRTAGTGTFRPGKDARPFVGTPEKTEEVQEERIEVLLPKHRGHDVLKALKNVHPYEEAAYYLHELSNIHDGVGAGIIGLLDRPTAATEFFAMVKEKIGIPYLRHTPIVCDQVEKIALCGGAGSFLIGEAKRQKADVFITADLKYHDFFLADEDIVLVDAGHYETEQCTKELIYRNLSEKFANIALHLSQVNTNPIIYT